MFNHRITQINKVNEKNTVLSFFIHERLFQYPSTYLTDKWLDYNNWCNINIKIENLDQNELRNELQENKSIFHHIPESHIVLNITPRKVTSKLIEAVQQILNNDQIEFNCYLEIDIKYDPDYSVIPKCDSGLSFDERPIEIDRTSSYSPTQQQHDKYTPQSIETNGSTSMEISPVYISNQVKTSMEEYVPVGSNSNSIHYTPSKVSNKKHDGYNPVSPASSLKENNNDSIVYIPAKPNVTKRKKSPRREDLITEKRNTRSASQSPDKKLITKLPSATITKSSSDKNDKPSTSKRSSTKDCDFVEPLEKKAKQKERKINALFGTFDSSQDSDCNTAEVNEPKSITFFENEELLSQTSQNSRSSNSPDMFNDSDIAPSQENEESLLDLKMKDIEERYADTTLHADSTLDSSSTNKSKTRSKSHRKDKKKPEYVSEKKGMTSFLSKKPDDSKDTVLNSWLNTELIEPEKNKKNKEQEPAKKVKIKGPTKAERNELEKERSKLMEKKAKEVEQLKKLGKEMLALSEKDDEKVETLSFNDISVDTFISFIHRKIKYFNRIFAEYCLQKSHKVIQHKVNFMIIPKLMDEAKHLAIISEFSNIYKKDDDDDLPVLDKYTDLYFEQMMPELILQMTMKHHDMSKEDAISRINKQSQLFPAELENTLY